MNFLFFAGMGGIAMKPGDFDIVQFPGVVVNLHLRQPAAPSTGPSEGSMVNHVANLNKGESE